MESLGEKIRRVRKLLKLNQNDFSRVLGISQGTLSDLEQNNNKPSLETSIALNKAFQQIQEPLLMISSLENDLTPLPLSDDENRLLLLFRELSRSSQNELIAYAKFKVNNR